MSEPVASIIIPVYNRGREVRGLLEQLAGQSRLDFEVVVVDDGSDVPVADEVGGRDWPYGVKLVRLDSCGGIAGARNAGVQNASGAIIIFLDSDCILQEPAWVERHVGAHVTPWTPALVALGADVDYVVHSRVIGIHSTYAGYSDGYSNWFISCGDTPYEACDHHVPTNNTSVRRRVFDKTGLFDVSFAVLEDVDWSFRCRKAGVRLFYVPEMPVGHVDRDTWRGLWEHYEKLGAYSIPIRKKHRDSPYQGLFPSNRFMGWLYFVPLTSALTVYILLKWVRVDARVLWYAPGLWLANIAYYRGIQGYLARHRGH